MVERTEKEHHMNTHTGMEEDIDKWKVDKECRQKDFYQQKDEHPRMVGMDPNEEVTWMSRNILSDDDAWKKDHRRRPTSHQQGSQDVVKIAL